MTEIIITEKETQINNLLYIQSTLAELIKTGGCGVSIRKTGGRAIMTVETPECYCDVVLAEITDKVAEVIVVKYKYDFLEQAVRTVGLRSAEREILLISLIAADFSDDKRYVFERLKSKKELAIDGAYNFMLQPLKKKWEDVASYIPSGFMSDQLHEFVKYLSENRKKRVYVDNGRVYDAQFRRLKRCSLLSIEKASVFKEVLLSNCGEIELSGAIDTDDEFYLKEYFGDKIIFSGSYN